MKLLDVLRMGSKPTYINVFRFEHKYDSFENHRKIVKESLRYFRRGFFDFYMNCLKVYLEEK